MITIFKTVNFGPARSGLSTVGYTILNTDGSTKQARTTAGVSEIVPSSGIYGADVSFDDNWNGILLWDTGETTPKYGSEDFNYLQYSGGGGSFYYGGAGPAGIVVDNIWTREEKQKLLASLSELTDLEKGSQSKLEETLKRVKNLEDSQNDIMKTLIAIMDEMQLNHVVKEVGQLTLDNREVMKTINGLRESVGNLKGFVEELGKDIDLSIKIGTKLIKAKDLDEILKEMGIDTTGLTKQFRASLKENILKIKKEA